MDLTKQLENLQTYEKRLVIRTEKGIRLAQPTILSEVVTIMAILLAGLVEPLSGLELQYRELKAKRYSDLLKQGVSRSAASDEVAIDVELARLKVNIGRVENVVRRTEQIITTVQSHLKSKGVEARNAY